MAVTGARKDFPAPRIKPPGWVFPPNTQPNDPIRTIIEDPKKKLPIFPGAPRRCDTRVEICIDDPVVWPPRGNDPPVGTGPKEDDIVLFKAVSNGEFGGGSNNQIIAGSNRNTVAGIESNVLQGGSPENAAKANPLAAMGGENAAFSANAVRGGVSPKAGCTRPYFLFDGGGVTFNPPCDCYVSTGIDVVEIATAIMTGGTGAGAIRLFKGAKKLSTIKAVTKKASSNFNKLAKLKDQIRKGDIKDLGIMKTFAQRAIKKSNGTDVPLDEIDLDDIENFSKEIIDEIDKDRFIHKKLYNDATGLGKRYGDRQGFERLQNDQGNQLVLGMLSLAGGLGAAGTFIMGALDYLDFEIYRKKDCAAKNRGTLEACQCVCDDETYTECYDSPALAKIDTIMSPILSFFPILTLGAYASQDEYVGCDAPCTCLSYRQQDVLGNELCDCVCDPPDLPYGNGPCEYERDFDSDTCCCTCPAGSDLAEGSTKGTYARLSDNLGSPAPSAFHESYSTGCNYICDGREADSSNMISPWPPECGEGYIWVADPAVCDCVPECQYVGGTCTYCTYQASCPTGDCADGYTWSIIANCQDNGSTAPSHCCMCPTESLADVPTNDGDQVSYDCTGELSM